MSITTNDSSNRTAQEVGWVFVREYCKLLHEKPESLCHFYDKQSSLIRGLEGEEVKICQGQQEIQKNITEMQLKDASIKIINVDSLDFLDGKVVVQVIGEISNKSEAYKKFVRTVILAKTTPTGDNYSVLSDIFRYLKDENVDVIKHQSIDQESSYMEDGVSTLNEEKSANGEDSISTLSTGTLAEESAQESAQESGRESKGVEEAASDIPPTKTSVVEAPKSSAEDMTNQAVDENTTNNEKSNSSGVRSKGQSGPISVQTEKLATTSSNAISPTEQKSKPPSWANLAASDSQKWDNTQLAEPKGRVVSPHLTRSQSQQSQSSNRDRDREQRVVSREFSLYVRGIVEGMNKSVLEKAFTSFGFVKNLDVVPSKSCAFVEFSTQEAYQQALSHKRIEIQNFGHVTVEERKQKEEGNRRRYENNSYHPRNNYNNHNGINSQRGGGGRNVGERRHSSNNASRPPTKS